MLFYSMLHIHVQSMYMYMYVTCAVNVHVHVCYMYRQCMLVAVHVHTQVDSQQTWAVIFRPRVRTVVGLYQRCHQCAQQSHE